MALPSRTNVVCCFYNISHGCSRGDECRFVHDSTTKAHTAVLSTAMSGQEMTTPPVSTKPATILDPLSPKAQRPCKWFQAGYCRRGQECWFAHISSPEGSNPEGQNAQIQASRSGAKKASEPAACTSSSEAVKQGIASNKVAEDGPICGICLEVPSSFGLLEKCSHPFCLGCLRSWRRGKERGEGPEANAIHKTCPICRARSFFIVPSNVFVPAGAEKDRIVARYREHLVRTPCRNFERTKYSQNHPYCAFGDECFYGHRIGDKPYKFHMNAVEIRRWNRSLTRGQSRRSHTYDNFFSDDDDLATFMTHIHPRLDDLTRALHEFAEDYDSYLGNDDDGYFGSDDEVGWTSHFDDEDELDRVLDFSRIAF
ncbi:hypothetical protein K437DRAFT_259009 [Tilletiaria anomala UBC 951]|uniref:Uncharacterized protein n=1 Tax=Tilletiaria anomala (strain ATCC 24038 / CBS 436.72 / UBC 951) TaxID=1037660 RepID=A0A066VGU0_TILAU|nr:uncharacterized protein K437DRAFT_259009 [Tilletiaria anomala UBC 951]KDN39518.1 hypothetical protein K437DRAFT_259009 [Tilletiaria anomala UBC 951]